jgi:hypothetical protein
MCSLHLLFVNLHIFFPFGKMHFGELRDSY